MSESRQKPLVDEQGTLRRLGGDRELFQEFISIYMQDSQIMLLEIREGLQANDASEVGKSAHALKGLISNFGAKEFVDVVLEIERAGRAGDVSECGDDFRRLEQLQQQLSDELHTIS